MNIFIEESKSYNPYENLAYEAALAEFVSQQALREQEIYGLFLWQNDSSIVFGRHQCIKAECNLELAEERKVTLSRRLSGGGAVYHDLGNLNYTFISKDGTGAREKNEEVVLRALKRLGIEAEISGRNDILASDRKFSGNAYSSYKGLLVHHGTIMVSLDIEMANRLLTPPEHKLKAKGIESVSSRIVNLSQLDETITIQAVKKALKEEFLSENTGASQIATKIDRTFYENQQAQLSAPAFINADQEPGQLRAEGSFGTVAFSIKENNGKISKILFESDILQAELLQLFIECLEGCSLKEDCLTERYDQFITKNSDKLSDDEIAMIGRITVTIIENIGD